MDAASDIMKPIRVLDYDPAWPRLFEALRTEIEQRLGDIAADIHHVGSTSVPGLAAKPKIDIDALVAADRLPQAVARMRAVEGYTFHGDPHADGMWTFTQGRGGFGMRLYLCAPDNPVHERRILFRDHLRAHPGRACAYAALKRRLAELAGGDWDVYTGGKSAFVAETVALALKERDAEGAIPRPRPSCP
jgi:GrpB-like predicted nucleotidyltransferase (UPF0157 family)